MEYQGRLETIFHNHGAADFIWIDPKEIVTAQWVRMKCMFGCKGYGARACCPPSTPSVPECRQFFDEYEKGVIFHFTLTVESPEAGRERLKEINEKLLHIEREVLLQGYQKVFLLPASPCSACGEECAGTKDACRNPMLARPTPEGMAIDVFSSVRKYGFPIQVLTDYGQTMNRYAFLLVE